MREANPTTSFKQIVPVQNEYDVRQLKRLLVNMADNIEMSMLNRTKLLTAASELMRNMLKYGGGGQAIVEVVFSGSKDEGMQLTFTDKGPGIPDINVVMQDGYSTGNTLGIGLPGAKRLTDEFLIMSEVNKGTTVIITKWANG